MQVSHQIRARREALGVSIQELAQKVGVTEQAVRHWESGRSYPGKGRARVIEEFLKFHIDWTEGVKTGGPGSASTAMINPRDLDLLLLICRLPADFKGVMEQLASLHLKATERPVFAERETARPIEAFRDRDDDEEPRRKRASGQARGGAKRA